MKKKRHQAAIRVLSVRRLEEARLFYSYKTDWYFHWRTLVFKEEDEDAVWVADISVLARMSWH